jgi:hypothetical protein
MAPKVTQLLAALEAMPSRSAAILTVRCVKELSRDGCAQLYGISAEAFDALLLRSANDLAQVLGQAPTVESAQAAAALGAALELPGTPGAPAAVQALRAERAAVAASLTPPPDSGAEASAKEKWLRRAAILIVLLLTGYFYWQEKHAEPKLSPRPGQPTRVVR